MFVFHNLFGVDFDAIPASRRRNLISGWIGHRGLRFHDSLLLAQEVFLQDEQIEVDQVVNDLR